MSGHSVWCSSLAQGVFRDCTCGVSYTERPAAEGTNPKDAIGLTKVPLDLVPDVGLLHEAMAFKDGAKKYGAYNWRTKKVKASIYIAAARRHLMRYAAGEEIDPISKVHHLGHARACLGILLDAAMTGNLVDDRQTSQNLIELMDKLTENTK